MPTNLDFLGWLFEQRHSNKEEMNYMESCGELTDARKHYYDGCIDTIETIIGHYKQEEMA